jgi:hypothetical protein
MANIRKQRNFIHALQTGTSLVVSPHEKQEVVFNHFLHHIGTRVPRSWLLNLSELGWQPRELNNLELSFPEEEIRKVIMSVPKEKAPGLDDFIGSFFSHC